jgi:hypothetical protein
MGKIQIFSNIRYSDQLEKLVIDVPTKSEKYSKGSQFLEAATFNDHKKKTSC